LQPVSLRFGVIPMTELNNLVHRVNIEFNTNNFLEDYEGHFMVDRQYDISGKFDFSVDECHVTSHDAALAWFIGYCLRLEDQGPKCTYIFYHVKSSYILARFYSPQNF
jgi:hypothetical protein